MSLLQKDLFQPQPGSLGDALRLLDKPEIVRMISQLLLGDDSLSAPLRTNQNLRRAFAEVLYRYPAAYRSWDLKYSDLDRAMAWKADFDNQVKADRVAQFHYIWLPNDHTDGFHDKGLVKKLQSLHSAHKEGTCQGSLLPDPLLPQIFEQKSDLSIRFGCIAPSLMHYLGWVLCFHLSLITIVLRFLCVKPDLHRGSQLHQGLQALN